MTIDELRIHAAQKLQEINEYLEGGDMLEKTCVRRGRPAGTTCGK